MRERKKSRSDHYQWVLLEVVCPDTFLDSFTSNEDFKAKLNPFVYDERVLDLKDQLAKRLWDLVEMHCTETQKTVARLFYLEGRTQMEISAILGVNQSSITKCIHGNVDYHRGKRRFGGIGKKLRKVLNADPIYQQLIAEITELQEAN